MEVGPNELVGVAELVVREEEVSDCGWSLVGEGAGFFVARWLESEGAVLQHLLGIVACVGRCLDAEAAEHGVRFRATEEHDGVLVTVGAKEGGGAARSQGASAE